MGGGGGGNRECSRFPSGRRLRDKQVADDEASPEGESRSRVSRLILNEFDAEQNAIEADAHPFSFSLCVCVLVTANT